MFACRNVEMWSTVGSVTKLPPPAPFAVRMRFCAARTRSASRTVPRLTPNSRARTASLGSRAPRLSSPRMIQSRSWS